MLQKAAGRKKCSSAEQIVRKSVGSGIFSLLILPDQKFEVDKKQSLLTQQELFTFPIGATEQSEVQLTWESLNYSPRPCAIFLVVARSLVYDGPEVRAACPRT